MVQGKLEGRAIGRRRRKALAVIVAVACVAVALGAAQLLLPQELILEKVKGRLERKWGVRPEVEGFSCTILGTFRAEKIRASNSTSWVRLGVEAERVKGRVSFLPLLRKRVELAARAEELHARLTSSVGSESEAFLSGVSLRVRENSGERETRMKLAARSAVIDDVEGGQLEVEAVERDDLFVLQGASWDLAPGLLSVRSETRANDGAHFSVAVEVEGIELGRIPAVADFVEGTISGGAEVRGGVASGLGEASISFVVEDGIIKRDVVEDSEELKSLGELALGNERGRLDEGLPFQELDVSLVVNAAGVTIRSLELSGEDYRVSGTGFASMGGKLSFLLRGEFPGRRAANITIEGSVFSPKVSWVPVEAIAGVGGE
jgi:hypothetical protein